MQLHCMTSAAAHETALCCIFKETNATSVIPWEDTKAKSRRTSYSTAASHVAYGHSSQPQRWEQRDRASKAATALASGFFQLLMNSSPSSVTDLIGIGQTNTDEVQ